MKSDHAIPPAGIAQRPPPPSSPPRQPGSARTAPLPSATIPALPRGTALPRGNRRYLPPSPVTFRSGSRTRSLSFLRDGNLFLLSFVGLTLAGMFYLFVGGLTQVTIRINEQVTTVWTRQQTVRDVLVEAGVSWNPEDIIRPGLDHALPADGNVAIRLATPLVLTADGSVLERRTQATTINQVLKENKITLKPQDQVFLEGRLVRADALLPKYSVSAGEPALFGGQTGMIHLTVTRALPITINDNGTVSTLFTTENTLGTALAQAGVEIYEGDSVTPDLTTPVSTGASIFIRRSRPASITVDGKTIRTRTRAGTVNDLLSQEGVKLEGKDFAIPAPVGPVVDYVSVNVTRVREEIITQTEDITFAKRTEYDPHLEIDHTVLAQVGQKGVKNRVFKSTFQNGKLVSTEFVGDFIPRQPQTQITKIGTGIIVRDVTLPDGSSAQYWRKIRLLATAYTAATSGKDRSDEQYGRTRLGLQAGYGIVAVDPRIINLGSKVYVPGYGPALAGDTGGRIKGMRIDLGFPEDAIQDWYKWVDVYLLTPVPPGSQLTVNLTPYNYPVERKNTR